MGPSQYREGNWASRWASSAAVTLQWGPPSIGREIALGRLDQDGVLAASMGPSQYREGNRRPRPGEHLGSGASMGPSQYREGNGWSTFDCGVQIGLQWGPPSIGREIGAEGQRGATRSLGFNGALPV